MSKRLHVEGDETPEKKSKVEVDGPVDGGGKDESKVEAKPEGESKVEAKTEVETKVEAKTEKIRKAGWGVEWYDKFIPIPPDGMKITWSAASHRAQFQDAAGKEFTIVAARTEHTAAVVKEQPKRDYRGREIAPDTPLVSFRTDEEVVTYLSKRATHVSVKAMDLFRYRTVNNKYVDKRNIELPDEVPDVDESDEALWRLYSEYRTKKRKAHEQLPFTTAEQVAKEFLLADAGLLTITKQLLAAWARVKGMTIDDHNGGCDERKVDEVTLQRREYKLIPSAAEVAAHRFPSRVAHGTPTMAIGRRENDVHYSGHDEAWISIWNYCGNPYYISKRDGRVHLSTCASGSDWVDQLVEHPPFVTCLDAGGLASTGEGNRVIRHVSLSRERLQAVVDEITPKAPADASGTSSAATEQAEAPASTPAAAV